MALTLFKETEITEVAEKQSFEDDSCCFVWVAQGRTL